MADESNADTPDELITHFGDCHNHIRNMWVKAITSRMCKQLTHDLKSDIDSFPPHLRIRCDLMNEHQCIDKEINATTIMQKVMATNTIIG